MDVFPIQLFPQGGLAYSVVTTVWVGVMIVAGFNLRLGWSAAGLVVPGYLAPLILTQPASAVVTWVGGMAAYFLVWIFSEALSRLGYWSSLFGRSRFFAFLLAGVWVRLAFDGWLLPALEPVLVELLGEGALPDGRLSTFGLIVIALIANQYWLTGFIRGLAPQLVTTALTCLTVRYVLMGLTNFSLTSLSYMYEDMAISFEAAPKSYILLLTGAYLASRLNMLYGWDFHGILVPSLLTLLWHDPSRIASTFLETMVILSSASLALRSGLFKGITMEGSRKLLLFFNISFAYRFLLSYAIVAFASETSETKVSDVFGFGYLVATLMAVKMHDKEIPARLTRSALQCSLMAAVAGNFLGFGLTLLPLNPPGLAMSLEAGSMAAPVDLGGLGLNDLLRVRSAGLVAAAFLNEPPPPDRKELAVFRWAIAAIAAAGAPWRGPELSGPLAALESLGFSAGLFEGDRLLIADEGPGIPKGLFLLDGTAPSGLLIQVPAPELNRHALEVGLFLFQRLRAGSFAAAGGRVTADSGSYFHAFHETMADRNVLQIVTTGDPPPGFQDPTTILNVKRVIPAGLDLSLLNRLLPDYRVEWRPAPGANAQRDAVGRGFAQLTLASADRRRLLASDVAASISVKQTVLRESLARYVVENLLAHPGEMAPAGSELYVPPSPLDLVYLDRSVLTPLEKIAARSRAGSPLDDSALQDLRIAGAAATTFGYEIRWQAHTSEGREYLLLQEMPAPAEGRRFWGTCVFRLGPAAPALVTVPRPAYESRTFEFGADLFERLQGSHLFFARAHPLTNRDGSSDTTLRSSRPGLLHLATQIALRQDFYRSRLVVECRGYGGRPDRTPPSSEALLAVADGTTHVSALDPILRALHGTMTAAGIDVALADGTAGSTGYGMSGSPYLAYAIDLGFDSVCTLWISPSTRSSYAQSEEGDMEEAQFEAAGVPSLHEALPAHLLALAEAGSSAPIPPGMEELVDRFVISRDVMALVVLREQFPDFRFKRLVDPEQGRSFLLAGSPPGSIPHVASLSARNARGAPRILTEFPEAESIVHFMKSGVPWLMIREAP